MPRINQIRANVKQRAEWIYQRPDIWQSLQSCMTARRDGRIERNINGETADQTWRHLIKQLQKAGLYAPTTYYRDVHLIKEYTYICHMTAQPKALTGLPTASPTTSDPA